MKLLLINSVCGYGSTGRLCVDIAKTYEQDGYEVKIAYGRSDNVPEDCRKYAVRIGSSRDVYLHMAGTRLTDRHGLYSAGATRRFLEWADEFDPDLLWLHNIHGYYLNYELLFEWIKARPQMPVKWTLHDCWAFTGHCAYYTYVGCDRWLINDDPRFGDVKTGGCGHCPQRGTYPRSIFTDNSAVNYLTKKKAFTGVGNLSIITPSVWLKNQVRQSFLAEYPVQVVYNRIDTAVFRQSISDFRAVHDIKKNDYMMLGVANVWEKRKGLDDLIELHRRLVAESYSKRGFCIVLVGLNDKQLKQLPDGMIGIKRLGDPRELARIYTAADVVLNPTYEDNYPSVILEAEACGTPVITYDTGGCAEAVHISGSKVIPRGVDNLEKEVLHRLI
ncbi:MAG: glycosyltransferase [Lachnospiraceae bacterium]|nr:glycosyltransferase [Lachnospiraceae bacterium]